MRILLALTALAVFAAAADKNPKKLKKDDWQPMFDGSTLDGWKASDHPEAWSVKDGAIRGDGPGSYLFYMNERCFNCEFKAQVRINHGGNSGMFFRSPFSKSPNNYEAQIDSTHRDPVRTGSLYHFVNVLEVIIPDDTWFTQRVVVEGNHIQIFVNDKQTVDFIDEKNTRTDGLFALQQHNAGSIVEFKNLMFKPLPPPKSPLVGTWHLKPEESTFSAGELPKQLEIRILEERDGIRYQSESLTTGQTVPIQVTTGGDTQKVNVPVVNPAKPQKRGANFFGRLDGYDYVVSGSPDYDHISIEEIDRKRVHEALKVAKIRKKPDEHYYLVIQRRGFTEVGRATYTLSADGNTLRREGALQHDKGDKLNYVEIFQKVEP